MINIYSEKQKTFTYSFTLIEKGVLTMTVQLKRIYEDVAKNYGKRILVDRVWPRGISKENAHIDEWFKEIGPSKELRQWFNHDANKFEEFKRKYRKELQDGEQKASYDKLKAIQTKKRNHPTS